MKKPLHLILEGSDKVGKTTVCNLLSKKLKLPIIKMKDMPKLFHSRPEEASEIFNKTIVQFKDFSFICDRGYPSSIVYNKYFKRGYNLSYLDSIVNDLEPKIFVLIGESRENDDIISKRSQRNINTLYKLFSEIHGWELIYVDNKSPEDIVDEITNKLK